MDPATRSTVRGSIQVLLTSGAASGLPDSQLLERFLVEDGEIAQGAFEALELRHGPMVLHTCHNLLPSEHDVQDAFQSTFLVLAVRAGSIRRRASLPSWLHGVALKVAARTEPGGQAAATGATDRGMRCPRDRRQSPRGPRDHWNAASGN